MERTGEASLRRVAVSGSHGLVGSALGRALHASGIGVLPLLRRRPEGRDGVLWDPARGLFDHEALEGVEAVVHLAGVGVASGRWTEARKAAIRDSRVEGTRLLAEGLARLRTPPRVLVSASAVGIYGDRGDEVLTETSAPGRGYLAEVATAWEAAAGPAAAAGIRVVHPRISMVLSASGGALARMLTPFRLGLGGPVGGGRQWTSWIHVDDLVAVLIRAIADPGLAGPVHAASPGPLRQRDFARCLARVLHRPCLLPLPAFAVRLLFGEMGESLLLSSARLEPRVLGEHGFTFGFPELEPALRDLLGR